MTDKMKAAFDAVVDPLGFDTPEHRCCALTAIKWTLDYLRSQQEPFAWFDDGTIRSGSESTAHRVVSDATKKDMPRAASISFNSPLYAHPIPSAPAVFEDLPGMSTMNRTISYAAAYKLRELGYYWDSQELQWTGAPAVPEWQPIDTAPPDEVLLLGWWATWPRDEWQMEIRVYHCTRAGSRHGYATHWMPLPAAPSPTEKKEN